jgi:hypothetical protein
MMKPSSTFQKILAVLEVFLVGFVGVPLLTLGIYRIFPTFETWQTETAGFPFAVFVNVIMAGFPLAILLFRRKKLADYGLAFKPVKYHLDMAAACFIPVALANLPFGMGVDYTAWGGALILAAVQMGLLVALALQLRKKPSLPDLGIAAGLLLFPIASPAAEATAGKALVLFLTYALFVGFGEEILYRGYMQSRLNEVFGKPFSFFGVAFGWGAILTALLFGFTHIGVLRMILGLSSEVTLAWGFWTIFSGLVFSFVREKTGSILAPALLHGLPQAIAVVILAMV